MLSRKNIRTQANKSILHKDQSNIIQSRTHFEYPKKLFEAEATYLKGLKSSSKPNVKWGEQEFLVVYTFVQLNLPFIFKRRLMKN
jgi:hypothetical protein